MNMELENDKDKKFMICIAFVGSGVSSSANAVIAYTSENFSMLDSSGNVFGGTTYMVQSFDDTLVNTAINGPFFNGGIAFGTSFFGFACCAHEVRIFGEGVYTFNTTSMAGQMPVLEAVVVCNIGSKTVGVLFFMSECRITGSWVNQYVMDL